jgi:hypothetical protein
MWTEDRVSLQQHESQNVVRRNASVAPARTTSQGVAQIDVGQCGCRSEDRPKGNQMNAEDVRKIADNNELLEIGRKAIEDLLVEFRDSRMSMMCGNGFVIREKDGRESSVIRLRTDMGLQVALKAIAEHLQKGK